MTGKSQNTPTEWVDPDDAPELTAEFFQRATPMINRSVVSMEQFAHAAKQGAPDETAVAKPAMPALLLSDAEIVAAFEATRERWLDRINEWLRTLLKRNRPG